jgi:hypothetical protein
MPILTMRGYSRIGGVISPFGPNGDSGVWSLQQRMDWRYENVGPAYYPMWRRHITDVINARPSVADVTTTPTGTYPGSNAFIGGVLLPDGRVYCVSRNSTSARIYDPVADEVTTPTGTYPGSAAFIGGVLLPDGRVFCVPFNSTSARIYDPVADEVTTPTGTYPGSFAIVGGVLLPDGRVFCVPHNSTSSRLYGGGKSYNINYLLSAYDNKL